MYHYLYQIVSMVPDENGVCKVYSGIHSDELPPEQDDYFGSGTWITSAVEKYGRDKFIKTIVATFPTREEAYACETQWLEKLFYKFYGSSWEKFNRHHYNLRLNEGSRDGGSCHSDISIQKMREIKLGKTHTDETKQRMSETRTGKKHAEKTRKKIAETLTGMTLGIRSPNFVGFVIGVNKLSAKMIVFDGETSIQNRGFNSGCVSSCITGRRKSHKNFTFIRTTDEEFLTQLLAEDNFHDEQSKQILQNYLEG